VKERGRGRESEGVKERERTERKKKRKSYETVTLVQMVKKNSLRPKNYFTSFLLQNVLNVTLNC